MNRLIPDSIFCEETSNLDSLFHSRFYGIDIESLIFNFATEINSYKLELFLELFLVDTSIFDFIGLDSQKRIDFFKKWLDILRNCGSKKSIIDIAKILGASDCEISFEDVLRYNGEILYSGKSAFDGGAYNSTFSMTITITIDGAELSDRIAFENDLRKIIQKIQPARLFVRKINFI